ncbi:MAG: CesT family type III secretion system chaperone [Pseudomonadota bacterium]
MSKELYCQLVDQVRAKAGINDPELSYDQCVVAIEGINFVLLHGSVMASDSMFMYVDFGEVPADNKELVLQRLLETNLFMYTDTPSSFTINPESKHVILVQHVRLSGTTFEDLADRMIQAAQFAQMWRGNHFLHEHENQQS